MHFGDFDVTPSQNFRNWPLSPDRSFVVVFKLKRMITSLLIQNYRAPEQENVHKIHIGWVKDVTKFEDRRPFTVPCFGTRSLKDFDVTSSDKLFFDFFALAQWPQ